jgi:hypothetical protein
MKDDGGCGCRLHNRVERRPMLPVLGLAALWWLKRRSKRVSPTSTGKPR